MATIYQCAYRGNRMTSECGSTNQGKRDRCKGCKSAIVATAGHAIIANHRGDGNYSLADAVREFATMTAADKAAAKAYEADNQSALVARFIAA